MLLVAALTSFVVLATRAAVDKCNHQSSNRSQSLSLPITRHTDLNCTYYPVQSDRRRFTRLGNNTSSANSSTPVLDSVEETSGVALNNTGPSYEAKVGIGNPPTYYNLVIDTGSSNTWVGANAAYVKTNTSVKTPGVVGVKYGSAFFVGDLYNDTVTITPGVTASNQPIGVAFNTSGISPHDGILGIGPSDLTLGTLQYPHNASTIPTVTDSLFAQGAIKQNLVAVSFEPTVGLDDVNGELTFGVTDPAKYIGEISYTPITKSRVASNYWGIDAAIRYGSGNGSALGLTDGTAAGIVDTGTTLVYLSTNAYNRYVQATGGVLDSSTKLLRITNAQYANLQSLYFDIGGNTFELTRNAQIWRRAHNGAIQGDGDAIYLAVQDIGQAFPGMDFICGMAFLERFYAVFDSGNRRIGLARTHFTNATTN